MPTGPAHPEIHDDDPRKSIRVRRQPLGLRTQLRVPACTGYRFTFWELVKSLRRTRTTMRNETLRFGAEISSDVRGSVADLPILAVG
jgi:hypothetical protein